MNNVSLMFLHDIQAWFDTYKKYIYASGILAVAVVGGGYYFFTQRQRQYDMAYSALTQGYEDLMRAQENAELWDDVAIAGQAGSAHYGSTSLAPYFFALQAEAVAHKGDVDAALKLMDHAFEGLSRSNSLYYPFKIKYAQMQMSHTNEAIAQQGLSLLTTLAEDTANPQRDQALFYSGYHYWLLNNRTEAYRYWHVLRKDFGSGQQFVSPWVQVIEDFAFDMD